jgi:hypothetical protein
LAPAIFGLGSFEELSLSSCQYFVDDSAKLAKNTNAQKLTEDNDSEPL